MMMSNDFIRFRSVPALDSGERDVNLWVQKKASSIFTS